MQSAEQRYYLETNAVRALSRQLTVSIQADRKRVFTSFLAISEIISGSTESDFSERRAILRNIFNAKLKVDWRSPNRVFSDCFGLTNRQDPISEVVRRALSVVLSSTTLVEARQCGIRRRPPVDIQFLLHGKAEMGRAYVESRSGQNDSYRLALHSQPLKATLEAAGLGSAQARRKLNSDISSEMDKELLRQAATLVASGTERIGRAEELLKTYDGGLDYHIQASRWTQFEYMTLGNLPGENDASDILHFLYVNATTTMVSDDRLCNKIASALWPGKVIKIDEFKNLGIIG